MLRLELFVHDTSASTAFYTQVLGFEVVRQGGAYIAMRLGEIRIALNSWDELASNHYFRQGEPHPLLGAGTEIVLETDDVAAIYERVRTSGYPVHAHLTKQPWGLTDFRLVDPDGYYVRVTDLLTLD